MAEVVVNHLRSKGWTVYQEVEVFAQGERADIVATRGNELLVVECKLSLSLDLLAQAQHWLDYSPQVMVAIPKAGRASKARSCGTSILASWGVGVFEVAPEMPHLPARITSERPPVPSGKSSLSKQAKLLAALHPQQEHFAAAGNAEGKRWTRWKDSVTRAKSIIDAKPGIGVNDLVRELETFHWASRASARSGLIAAAKKRIFPGVTVKQGKGGRWQFYPTD